MKKFYLIIFLSLTINIQFIEFAQAIPGSFFRNIFKFFKGGTDDVMKNADDLIRNNTGQGNKIFKSEDELLKKLGIENGYKTAGPTQESLILEKVGTDSHFAELSALKNSNRLNYIKRLKKKKLKIEGEDELIEFVFDNESSSKSSGDNLFSKYIIINWIGKIYNKSDYYSKPIKEKKMLLICSNIDQVFYFALLMEQEPKRAFLVKNVKINNTKIRNLNRNKSLPIQELVVIEDLDNVKIMATKPEGRWPKNYFTIYNDQNFYYDQANSGNISPEFIKSKKFNNPKRKNNCSKANNEGLL